MEELDAPHEGHTLILNYEYDAVQCLDCNEWVEQACGDPDCRYCANRPDTPPEVKDEL